ncbi:hypothetical protein JQ596_24790 [Bradyrhizobium manausense]|uniref:hypothetical protein n=1 Tax=Bradyrhizobium TaxID=374 RepID=UPI001BA7B23B|nr:MULTISPECIES: hypothetical protein [Bradyrhizobium]MBR0828758.1 hypothetical protein [Bradyrhizobium manausense]UVO32540.1 hypothetical protein KUF59_18875 [Bradyrhizobium arachidis]
MADDRFPNDPYRPNFADDEYLREARRDSQLQADPELGEGPASSGKVALFAVAIALVLGAVFYGLNNTSVKEATTEPSAKTAQQTAPATNPAAPPGMRDVTPRNNAAPGVTTGAAPSKPVPDTQTPSDGSKSQ